MTPKQAIAFVKAKGIVLESGCGPVPSLAEAIAGVLIRGSWWAHPKAGIIFFCSRAVRQSPYVLVCRLVGGKVAYVHRWHWPALVRLEDRFDAGRLAVIQKTHTASGAHKMEVTAFREWVPVAVAKAAAGLTDDAAIALLPFAAATPPRKTKRTGRPAN